MMKPSYIPKNEYYEPKFARGNNGELMRMDYDGYGVWTISQRDETYISGWKHVVRGDPTELAYWARKMREKRKGKIPKQFGIRIAGRLDHQVRSIRPELQLMAHGSTIFTFPDKREFPSRCLVWAEADYMAGITVWVTHNVQMGGQHVETLARGLWSVKEIMNAPKSLTARLRKTHLQMEDRMAMCPRNYIVSLVNLVTTTRGYNRQGSRKYLIVR
ncbi:MAG: hypothetical protein P8M22_10875 [Phycisphaerales bacterium]|nr:hypothetical protein [Phycisphaerales bacterium]